MARTSVTAQLGLGKPKPKSKWIPRDQWLLEHADEIQATRERNARLRHLGANEYKPGKLGPHYVHGYRTWTLSVDVQDSKEFKTVQKVLERRTAYGLGTFIVSKKILRPSPKRNTLLSFVLTFKQDKCLADLISIFPTLVSAVPRPQVRFVEPQRAPLKTRTVYTDPEGSFAYDRMADQERERKRIDESNMNFRKLPPGQKPFSDMYTFDQ